jgi:hypothetical protein
LGARILRVWSLKIEGASYCFDTGDKLR